MTKKADKPFKGEKQQRGQGNPQHVDGRQHRGDVQELEGRRENLRGHRQANRHLHDLEREEKNK